MPIPRLHKFPRCSRPRLLSFHPGGCRAHRRLPDANEHDKAGQAENGSTNADDGLPARAPAAAYVFDQRVIERNRTAADVAEAPGQPGTFRMLSTIDSDSYSLTERKRFGVCLPSRLARTDSRVATKARRTDACGVDYVLTASIPTEFRNQKALENINVFKGFQWLRGQDLNLRPSGYECV